MGLWRIPAGRDWAERVCWLSRTRLAALGTLGLLMALGTIWMRNTLPMVGLWSTWLVAVLLGLAFYGLICRVTGWAISSRTRAFLVHLQLVCDVLVLTSVLHFTGGVENPLSVLYPLLVVLSSSFLHRRVALYHALFASLAWVSLLLLELHGLLPHYSLPGLGPPARYAQPGLIWAHSVVMGGVNIAASLLTSGVVERARVGEAELLAAQQSCEARLGQLEALTDELRRTDEQRTLFMRIVTHELRAPVAAIKSLLQLILTGYVPPERHLEFIAKAEVRANEQLELIGDLLDLAHIREGVHLPEASVCHVQVILADVMDMLQPRFAEQGLIATSEVQSDLPPVLASQEHLKQVWTNLISNAIKYNRAGGRVEVRLYCEGAMVMGCVNDTGIGISPQDQEHIFEDFYRTEAAKHRSRQGTGLGLAIVKAIVERYGGRVWCESSPGEGSSFYFALPAMPAHP